MIGGALPEVIEFYSNARPVPLGNGRPRPGERGLDGKLVPLPIPAQRSEEPSLCTPTDCGSCPLNGLCGDPADLPPDFPDVDPEEPAPETCCGGACGS